eukprot:31291-Pelagococcus_subviridis.AAC.2
MGSSKSASTTRRHSNALGRFSPTSCLWNSSAAVAVAKSRSVTASAADARSDGIGDLSALRIHGMARHASAGSRIAAAPAARVNAVNAWCARSSAPARIHSSGSASKTSASVRSSSVAAIATAGVPVFASVIFATSSRSYVARR